MKTGADDKRKTMIAGVLGVVALLAVGYELFDFFGGSPAARPAPAVAAAPAAPAAKSGNGPAAVKIGTSSAQLDPTLHMGPMLVTESLVYSGTGRNIFAPGSPEVAVVEIPKPIIGPRPEIKPQPPAPQGPPPAPPLPPINLKFFGTTTSASGTRRAFLLNGDDVFIASAGDIVQRRYRIISIDANKISVEDLPNSNKQTLPLVGQP
jgi:hypothetical protein